MLLAIFIFSISPKVKKLWPFKVQWGVLYSPIFTILMFKNVFKKNFGPGTVMTRDPPPLRGGSYDGIRGSSLTPPDKGIFESGEGGVI